MDLDGGRIIARKKRTGTSIKLNDEEGEETLESDVKDFADLSDFIEDPDKKEDEDPKEDQQLSNDNPESVQTEIEEKEKLINPTFLGLLFSFND